MRARTGLPLAAAALELADTDELPARRARHDRAT